MLNFVNQLENFANSIKELIYEKNLLRAQLDAEILKQTHRECYCAEKGHCASGENTPVQEIVKAYSKSDGRIRWYCEGCIQYFESINFPPDPNKPDGLRPEYAACFSMEGFEPKSIYPTVRATEKEEE